MKSTAQIKNHPVHPILVAFPIAFFTGTLLFDLLGLFFNNTFYTVGYYLEIAGVAGGLAAAIPGLIDYTTTVPPDSSAKKRGAKHGIINTCALLIFAGAWWYRRNTGPNPFVFISAEAAGSVLLLIGGYLGGSLVYLNQIAVHNRYAFGGRWQEKKVREKSGSIEVASADDLKTDQMMLVHVNDKRVVIGKTEEGFVAFDDRCTHHGGSLAGGMLICGTVQCPWHGSQFDVRNGAVKAGPASEPIATYRVREANGKIFLEWR